jgi:16S rRNA (cytidine1402-2'-O)-methyltransferase
VVATPIGNLGDLSARAAETLRTCDLIVAEDTRRTRQLLTHLGIRAKRVERLDAHATTRDVARIIERVLAGEGVAMVTDAGTPVVSDPGDALVRAAIDAGVRVVPVPGASAVLAALVASGLGGEGAFRFLGFLPRKGRARTEALATIGATAESVVLFEAPQRLAETLRDLADLMPDRPACVARELTKVHEETTRGTCATLAAEGREWLGEIAVVLGPCDPEARAERVDDERLDARIDEGLARGQHTRTLADRLAAWSGRPRRDVYDRITARKGR